MILFIRHKREHLSFKGAKEFKRSLAMVLKTGEEII